MALGYWYSQINAQVGDLVRLIFIFPVDIVGRFNCKIRLDTVMN